MRVLLCAALIALFVPLSASAKPSSSCAVSPDPVTLTQPRTGYFVSASVPVNSAIYSVVTGAGAPANEWTAIPQIKGTIDGAFVTTAFTAPGDVTLSIIDYRHGDATNVVATCSFVVQP